jgi:F-type H+-transporting ATPase subunit b
MTEGTGTIVGATQRGSFPPFQAETFATQLFWLVVCFVLLYSIVAKLGLPRVAAIFEKRRQRIGSDLAEASELKRRSEEALGFYQKAMTDARDGAAAVVQATRTDTAAEMRRSRANLDSQIEATVAEARNAIAAKKAAVLANVRGIAIETTDAITGRLIGARAAPTLIAEAVDGALGCGADANATRR